MADPGAPEKLKVFISYSRRDAVPTNWLSARFDPTASRLVTASLFDRTVRIFDAASGKEIAALGGHDGDVDFATFSPDGRSVLTASRDKTARIFDVTWAASVRGEELRERVCGKARRRGAGVHRRRA